MSQFEKLLQRIRNNPKTVKFDELESILLKNGYTCRTPGGGSSHYTYTKPGRFPITIPKKRPYVKEIYVKIVLRQMEDEK